MDLKWYGPQVDQMITAGAAAGLNASAQKVCEDAKRRTPHRTGALQDSLKVATAEPHNLVAIVYSDSPYAVYQHEIFSYRRTTGQPKFLESAANDYRKQFQQDLMNAIGKAGGSS